MKWKPFVGEADDAISVFKQAIVDTRGYVFPEFKKSRWKQKTLLQRLKTLHRGFKSNYEEIVKKNIMTVHLGYLGQLHDPTLVKNDFQIYSYFGQITPHIQKILLDYRILVEYHFFAIKYADPGIVDKILDTLHISSADYEFAKLWGIPLVKGLVGLFAGAAGESGNMVLKGGGMVYNVYDAGDTAKGAVEDAGVRRRTGRGYWGGKIQGAYDAVPMPELDIPGLSAGGVYMASNRPMSYIHGGGSTYGGLVHNLTETLGEIGTAILDWQIVAVKQYSPILVILDSVDGCDASMIEVGPSTLGQMSLLIRNAKQGSFYNFNPFTGNHRYYLRRRKPKRIYNSQFGALDWKKIDANYNFFPWLKNVTDPDKMTLKTALKASENH